MAQKDYTILGYGNDGQPIVFAPTVSPGKPIPLAEYEAIKRQQAAQSGPRRFMGQATKAAEMFAGAGGMGAAQGMLLGGPRGGGGGITPTRQPQQPIPTYTPEVVPGSTDLRAFSGRVSAAPRQTPALPAPTTPALSAPSAKPPGWTGMEPGGMSGGQVSQMDAAGNAIGQAFNSQPMVPAWAKGAAVGAAGAGAAYLAGRDSGEKSLVTNPPVGAGPGQAGQQQLGELFNFTPGPGQNMSMPLPDAFGQTMAEPFATPPPVAPPAAPTGPQRGPTRPMGGHKIAGGGAAQGVAGVAGGPGQQGGGGFAIGQNPRAPAANYYSDMLGAADSGDAYARDLVNLTSQARQVAFKAQQEGKRLQFVPLHDMRNNRLFLVNANGQDVVLDMNDEGDKAAFGRMTAKIGMDPASIMAWAQGSSRPLHRYMVPPGSQGDWAPQFGEPGTAPAAPQLGAAQEPTASPAPFELPQVPHFNAGQPLPSMRGLDIGADRPADANMAEVDMLRGQGLGGPQLDETERRLREQRANNPTAYARPQRG